MASASPRRKQLLGEFFPEFAILPAVGEETVDGLLSPQALVCALATQKAEEVASRDEAKGKAVVGADTVVALDGEVLGKPTSKEHAAKMLRALSGRVHEVFTGVCIVLPSGETLTQADCTRVTFEELTDEQIAAYVETGSPMDKAGAYGIQDGGLVKGIEGSFSNVVGFPCEMFANMLKKIK